MSRSPSRLTRRVLEVLTSADEADATLGDLSEELAAREAVGRARWSQVWLEVHAWRHVAAALGARRPLAAIWADVKYAGRRLTRERGFAAAAVVTLALSTGPTIAVLSLANWFYVRPMPGVTNQERLAVATFGTPTARGSVTVSRVSYANVAKLVAMVPAVVGIAGHQGGQVSVSLDRDAPRVVPAEFVSPNFFDVLGVRLYAGRAIRPEDDRSPTDALTAVISYPFARTLFPDAAGVGRTIHVNGHLVTVVGIAPPGFLGTNLLQQVAVWLPGMASRRINNAAEDLWLWPPDSGPFYAHVVRLAHGATVERANLELTAAATTMAQVEPLAKKFQGVRANLNVFGGFGATPVQLRTIVGILSGIGAVLVLLGVANLANLFVFRAVRRTQENAVRRALGASAARVAQLHLVEAGLIALCGCVAGLGLAIALKDLVNSALLPGIEVPVPIDWRLVAMTMGMATVVALLLAFLPSKLAAKARVAEVVARSGRGATPTGRRVRTGLAVVQLVLSLTLFVGALLFSSSLRNIRTLDGGFDPERVATFQFGFRLLGYQPDRIKQFSRDLLSALRRHPDVDTAALADAAPIFSGGIHRKLAVPGADTSTRVEVLAAYVTADYFRAVGTNLLSGRTFAENEVLQGEPDAREVILSRSLAERLYGSAHAVGRLASFAPTQNQRSEVRVVGVAEDTLFDGLTKPAPDVVYMPIKAISAINERFFVRARGPVDLGAIVRQAAASVATPAPPITQAETYEARVDRSLGPFRIFAWASSLLAAIGFVLAAVGIYGLVSQGAVERTREFGIRLALGADRVAIRWLVLRSALIVTAIGAPLGIVLSVLSARLIANQLFGVGVTQPAFYVAAIVALGAVVLLAGAVPAWSASRANPADVMRVE